MTDLKDQRKLKLHPEGWEPLKQASHNAEAQKNSGIGNTSYPKVE